MKYFKIFILLIFLVSCGSVNSNECPQAIWFKQQLDIVEDAFVNQKEQDSSVRFANVFFEEFFFDRFTIMYTSGRIYKDFSIHIDSSDMQYYNDWYFIHKDSLCMDKYKQRIKNVVDKMNPDTMDARLARAPVESLINKRKFRNQLMFKLNFEKVENAVNNKQPINKSIIKSNEFLRNLTDKNTFNSSFIIDSTFYIIDTNDINYYRSWYEKNQHSMYTEEYYERIQNLLK